MANLRETFLDVLGKASDMSTEIWARELNFLLGKCGVRVEITKSPEERIALLTEMFTRAMESGGIKEIKAALGGDDGDLDELAEALIRAGIVPPPGIDISRIRIKDLPEGPEGPAPVDVRRSWNGVELLAVKVPPAIEGEINFVTGETASPRDRYVVLASNAIKALREHSADAADWFEKNFPSNVPALSFGANEVEVVPETSE